MGRKFEDKVHLCVTIDRKCKNYLEKMANKSGHCLSTFVNDWILTAMIDLDDDNSLDNPAEKLIKRLFDGE